MQILFMNNYLDAHYLITDVIDSLPDDALDNSEVPR